jgi:hypothetical protein
MVIPHYLGVYKEGDVDLNTKEYSEYAWVAVADLDAFEPKIKNIPDMVRQVLRLKEVFKDEDRVAI